MNEQQLAESSEGKQDRLFQLAYDELRLIADIQMSRERGDHTLQPTALVHEAYLKLLRSNRFEWNDRAHFLALASRAMRQILIDFARRRNAGKRSAERTMVTLSDISQTTDICIEDYIAVHEALETLSRLKPNGGRFSRLIELIWFGGLEFTEAAKVLGISRRQAHRDWGFARVWLERELAGGS
jgi:RNA polymerase sigma factor (TIGR02999 family)